jgi:hypothetical protein
MVVNSEQGQQSCWRRQHMDQWLVGGLGNRDQTESRHGCDLARAS